MGDDVWVGQTEGSVPTFVNATIRISVSDFIPIKQPSASVSPYLTAHCTVQLHADLHLPPHSSATSSPSLQCRLIRGAHSCWKLAGVSAPPQMAIGRRDLLVARVL